VNLLGTSRGRKLLFAALYASEGAPIGYIWWALPTKLRDAGLPIDQVTHITAMLTLPWALKFLWAPMVDTIRTKRFGLRNWIVTTQLGMGLVLLPLIGSPLAERTSLLLALLLVHAFLAATQDASVDALCIATVSDHERGVLNGWMQAGMLTSRAVFGGVALRAETIWGTNVVLAGLLCCIWFSMALVTFFCREPDSVVRHRVDRQVVRRFRKTLTTALHSRRVWLGLAFAGCGGAAFEAAGAVAGPMLIDAGATKEHVGDFYALPVVLALGVGALVGGAVSDRIGRVRTVRGMLGGIAVAVSLVGLVYRTSSESAAVLFAAIGVLYLLIGAFTASSYALFMDLTDPKLGATQFSAFMGATNLCEVWAGAAAGWLAKRFDYALALWVLAAISLIAFPILVRLARSDEPRHPSGGGA